MTIVHGITLNEWRRVIADDDMPYPDGLIENTDVHGWQAALDVIVDSGWPVNFESDREESPLPGATELLARSRREALVIEVRPAPGVSVSVFVRSANAIDFDFDLRELTDQPSLDALCAFVRAIGKAVNRDVALTPEGFPERPFCVYSVARDSFRLIE